MAAKRNSEPVVRALISMSYQLDTPKHNGITALGIASYRGHVHLIEILTKAGANPHLLNHVGIGTMYLALKGDQIQAVECLLGLGVAVWSSEPAQRDNSPVFLAVRRKRMQALGRFVDKLGKKVFEKFVDSNGLTPLVVAAHTSNFDVIDYFSLRGISLNQTDNDGYSILFLVLLQHNDFLAAKLLQRGASINFPNEQGRTALTMAIIKKNKAII